MGRRQHRALATPEIHNRQVYYRHARVLLPRGLDVPSYIRLLEPANLPAPHRFTGFGVASQRADERSHHRMMIAAATAPQRYERKIVMIPERQIRFAPFHSTWIVDDDDNVWLTNSAQPARKVDRMMNTPMRDDKHPGRDTRDDSRAQALQLMHHRNPLWRTLWGALQSREIEVALDSALAVLNLVRR